jgi:alkanesulfonate monooxygenase
LALINRGGASAPQRQDVGSKRLLGAGAEAEVHDASLWTSLAFATGAQGNSTVCSAHRNDGKALLEYYKLGAASLLNRGYDPRLDAIEYGEELIPRVRELVADYDASWAMAQYPATKPSPSTRSFNGRISSHWGRTRRSRRPVGP